MHGLRRLLPGVPLLAALLATPRVAEAIVVERVVAVVGERAILLTDLRKRARPFLVQLYAKVPPGAQRAAAESRILSQLVERMVDEQLEAEYAARNNVTVTSEDIDKTLRGIARMSGITLDKLVEDVTGSSGMSEQEYRQEIRRQVLEGKLVNQLVQERVRVTEQELRTTFERTLEKERRVRLYRPAWIVIRVGDNPNDELLSDRMALANEIVQRARAGEDFGNLAAQYSEDPSTAASGGDLGIRAPAGSPAVAQRTHRRLASKIERVAMDLEPGQVSEPFRFKQGLVVMKLLSRQPSRYTTLRAARGEMLQRIRAEKMEKAKKKWLKDLRRRTHVDVRL